MKRIKKVLIVIMSVLLFVNTGSFDVFASETNSADTENISAGGSVNNAELETKKYDVVVAVDNSGSLSASQMKRRDEALRSLVYTTVGTDTRIGGVYFGEKVIDTKMLTRISYNGWVDKSNRDELADFFNKEVVPETSDTNIYEGTRAALELFNGEFADSGERRRILILFTDGVNDPGFADEDPTRQQDENNKKKEWDKKTQALIEALDPDFESRGNTLMFDDNGELVAAEDVSDVLSPEELEVIRENRPDEVYCVFLDQDEKQDEFFLKNLVTYWDAEKYGQYAEERFISIKNANELGKVFAQLICEIQGSRKFAEISFQDGKMDYFDYFVPELSVKSMQIMLLGDDEDYKTSLTYESGEPMDVIEDGIYRHYLFNDPDSKLSGDWLLEVGGKSAGTVKGFITFVARPEIDFKIVPENKDGIICKGSEFHIEADFAESVSEAIDLSVLLNGEETVHITRNKKGIWVSDPLSLPEYGHNEISAHLGYNNYISLYYPIDSLDIGIVPKDLSDFKIESNKTKAGVVASINKQDLVWDMPASDVGVSLKNSGMEGVEPDVTDNGGDYVVLTVPDTGTYKFDLALSAGGQEISVPATVTLNDVESEQMKKFLLVFIALIIIFTFLRICYFLKRNQRKKDELKKDIEAARQEAGELLSKTGPLFTEIHKTGSILTKTLNSLMEYIESNEKKETEEQDKEKKESTILVGIVPEWLAERMGFREAVDKENIKNEKSTLSSLEQKMQVAEEKFREDKELAQETNLPGSRRALEEKLLDVMRLKKRTESTIATIKKETADLKEKTQKYEQMQKTIETLEVELPFDLEFKYGNYRGSFSARLNREHRKGVFSINQNVKMVDYPNRTYLHNIIRDLDNEYDMVFVGGVDENKNKVLRFFSRAPVAVRYEGMDDDDIEQYQAIGEMLMEPGIQYEIMTRKPAEHGRKLFMAVKKEIR